MANLVYDEKIGWYDADEEYCANGDGKKATTTAFTGMNGKYAQLEFVCADCAAEPGLLLNSKDN